MSEFHSYRDKRFFWSELKLGGPDPTRRGLMSKVDMKFCQSAVSEHKNSDQNHREESS
jgi:hypothetical protein